MAKNKGKSPKKDKSKKKNSGGGDFGATDPSDSTFDGERWDKEEDLGELVAFVNIDSADVDTEHGPATAAEVDYIVILTGDDKNKVYENQLVFGAMLAKAIYGADSINGIVLGRLAQGEAKKGRNAPWLLEPATKKDHTKQEAWFNKYASRKKSGAIRINLDKVPF